MGCETKLVVEMTFLKQSQSWECFFRKGPLALAQAYRPYVMAARCLQGFPILISLE